MRTPRAAKQPAFFDPPAIVAALATSRRQGSAGAGNSPRGEVGYRAIYARIRREILDGALKPGARLPSTRALAATLAVARMTVVTAYEQLRAEGYIEGRVGSGTRVTAGLPAPRRVTNGVRRPPAVTGTGTRHRGRERPSVAAAGAPGALPAIPSVRGHAYAAAAADPADEMTLAGRQARAFRPGVPALDVFPIELWARLASRHYRRSSRLLFTDADPRGYRPLREAVANYLGVSRGVRCEAEQVVIVAGAQQGIHLAARICLDPGEAVWLEEPGYPNARRALLDAGVRVVPVPVDRDGLDVAAGRRRGADARLAFVTPAHQAPLGMVMSVGRRLALLEWARERGAWILEDDYDSEYRYSGQPLPALQGLDEEGERVLYLGTFSKTLFPALRLGYLVVPPSLVDAAAGARALVDRHSPLIDQAVVTDFLERGHFARHLRRTRALYAERQEAMLTAGGEELAGLVRLAPDHAGLQLLGWLPPGVGADAASRAARHAGVDCLSMAGYYAEPRAHAPEALMLGYAGFDGAQMRRAARALARAVRPLVRGAAEAPHPTLRSTRDGRAGGTG